MLLRQIFDPALAQYAYLIGCQRTGEALLIDPERDVDRYLALAAANDLRITAVAETHIHADFVSGAQELARDPDVRLYLSALGGPDWTYQWPGDRPNVCLLQDGEVFHVGGIEVTAIHTPGHTPEHLSFVITDRGGGADAPVAVATGDFLFVGDVGRPDLLESAAGIRGAMEPSARTLQAALSSKFNNLPEFVQILPAHGAGSACGKALGAIPTSTLGYERRFNRPFRQASEHPAEFVHEILTGQPEPPPYFATMKRVNRDGVAVTGGAPTGRALSVKEFQAEANRAVVLDTRADKAAFAVGHYPKSLHAPYPGSFFSVVAGSYLKENDRIVLVLSSRNDADELARQLYRIGFDGLVGFIEAHQLAQAGLLSEAQPLIQFANFDQETARREGVILDVRTNLEFSHGHIDGAVSLPYTRLATRLQEVPKDKRLFVHCGSGRRAAMAASFLRARGYDAVHVDGVCSTCEQIAQAVGITH
jgi:hydroxyacylglutathione hydrolase